jgi:Tannase and feruloyl esterase
LGRLTIAVYQSSNEEVIMHFKLAGVSVAATLLVACGSMGPGVPSGPIALGTNGATACAALVSGIDAAAIGLPTKGATIDSATIVAASSVSVAPGGATPASRVNPETPSNCRVLGRVLPMDASAPPILFQVNLPLSWNGRTLQYGGGGFNGSVTSATGLMVAGRYDQASPLAQGYVTYGTDSGHQNKPGEAPQAFAANEEAFVNFAHASYKKVRDVAVALTQRAYGRAPYKMYFAGSSEGGREGLTMAQRYPNDFDGIFSRVPVINWTGLMHVSNRAGLTTMGDAWLPRAKVELVHNAVLAACDELDGIKDNLVANPVACKARFDVSKLQCPGVDAANCLSGAQVKAVQSYYSSYKFPFALANGVTEYPGWGVSGEGTPAAGPTGGWSAWYVGNSVPSQPAKPDNGISWFFGSGALRHIFVREPNFDVTKYAPELYHTRVLEVSALMDSTNPDLSAFNARGGKLMMLEYMADYAQSPYAGIGYYESVVKKMGSETTDKFVRLYTAPGVDHVGSGAPGNVDVLTALSNWVERGQAPANLTVVDQELKLPFATVRELPLCAWPAWPRYRSGDVKSASSFECVK